VTTIPHMVLRTRWAKNGMCIQILLILILRQNQC